MARNRYDIDETLDTPFNIKHLKRAGKYIAKHKGKMIISLIFSSLAAVFSLAGPKFVERTLNVSVPNKDIKEIVMLSIAYLATIIISIVLTVMRSKYMTIVGQEIVYEIRHDVFTHLQELPFKYYDERPHGKILTRVINYVNNVSDSLSNGIIDFVLEIFNLVIIAVFMLSMNVKLSLVVFAGVPFFVLIAWLIKPSQRKAWQSFSNKSSNLNAYLHESLDGAKITSAFTREEENAEIFDRLNKSSVKSWMKAVYTSNLTWYSVENISIIVLCILYIVGLLSFKTGIQIGTIVAMGTYAGRFWQPILSLSNLYNSFINTIAYLERIFETIDEPVDIKDADNAYTLPEITGNVTFDDVTFAYEKENVIEHLNLNIKSGESIALVGPTGAGKSTIVSLLSRFYDVNQGEILVDGNDISKVTLQSLRSQMGIMLQDSFIFSGTIEDNIRYGRLNATKEEIVRAAKIVCADEFINEFEKGYDTQVNERGSRLSGGQKQLIAFARTLLSDPKILVLDEATSSIDAKTERMLQKGFNALLKGRTSFIIAHRLSTIKNCDRIMYVSNKGIAESGSHDELMAMKGLYYNLYTSQLE